MKDLAIAILGKPKKSEEEPSEEGGESGSDLALAMKTLAAALKAEDFEGAAEAFKSANELCGYESHEEE